MRFVIFYIVFLSIALTGCNRNTQICCIKIGEFCVDRQNFKDRMERFAEESMITSPEDLKKMKPVLVENIIEEQLIMNYAKKKYITVSEEEIAIAMKGFTEGFNQEDLNNILIEESRDISDIKGFIKTRAIINKTIDKAVKQRISISPEEIKQYYDQHAKDYYRDESVELYHVYLKDQLQAKEALVSLRSGVPLQDVVKKYNDTEDDKNVGFMGVFSKGELPKDVEEVVFTIPEHRYSGIIETQRGYHIFYVAKRTKPGTLPLETVADEINDKLSEDSFEKAYAVWMNTLKQQYKPEVNWDEINAISLNK